MIRSWLGGLCLAGLVGMAMAAPNRESFDPDRSAASFGVKLRLSGDVPGQFGRIEGELEPESDGRWRVQVRVDARELDLEGPGWMLRSTRSKSFLDVDRHPEIRFTSEPFERSLLMAGGPLQGQLYLRGRSRAVTFTLAPSDCKRPGHGCEIRVLGDVSRRSFGMTSQRMWLRDEVSFDFRVRLRKPAAP
jgi:polyisoprenoid-binding protein YceI